MTKEIVYRSIALHKFFTLGKIHVMAKNLTADVVRLGVQAVRKSGDLKVNEMHF